MNDPATAVQTLDYIDGLLRALGTRDLAVHALDGPDGTPRLVLKVPPWEDYVSVALDEMISMGSASSQVRRRICRLLDELLVLVPAARRRPIEVRLERVRAESPSATASEAASVGRTPNQPSAVD